MSQPIRSLSGLIDFECAARWGGFRLAAVELHKTPAAVSQQVKQLEHSLGFALFTRHPRQITLTDKGHELASTVARLLKDLRAHVGALQVSGAESMLRVSATHSLAMKWLVPRMHRFTRHHPEFDIHVESSDQVAALDDDVCDIAIRHSRLADGDADDVLFRDQLVVAYSPDLVNHGDASGAPPPLLALLEYPILYKETPETWLRLLKANRISPRRHNFSRSYSRDGLLVQAAVAGLGIALLPYSLAYEDIASERLLVYPAKPLASAYGYRLHASDAKREAPKIRLFTDWIRLEADAMAHEFDARLRLSHA